MVEAALFPAIMAALLIGGAISAVIIAKWFDDRGDDD